MPSLGKLGGFLQGLAGGVQQAQENAFQRQLIQLRKDEAENRRLLLDNQIQSENKKIDALDEANRNDQITNFISSTNMQQARLLQERSRLQADGGEYTAPNGLAKVGFETQFQENRDLLDDNMESLNSLNQGLNAFQTQMIEQARDGMGEINKTDAFLNTQFGGETFERPSMSLPGDLLQQGVPRSTTLEKTPQTDAAQWQTTLERTPQTDAAQEQMQVDQEPIQQQDPVKQRLDDIAFRATKVFGGVTRQDRGGTNVLSVPGNMTKTDADQVITTMIENGEIEPEVSQRIQQIERSEPSTTAIEAVSNWLTAEGVSPGQIVVLDDESSDALKAAGMEQAKESLGKRFGTIQKETLFKEDDVPEDPEDLPINPDTMQATDALTSDNVSDVIGSIKQSAEERFIEGVSQGDIQDELQSTGMSIFEAFFTQEEIDLIAQNTQQLSQAMVDKGEDAGALVVSARSGSRTYNPFKDPGGEWQQNWELLSELANDSDAPGASLSHRVDDMSTAQLVDAFAKAVGTTRDPQQFFPGGLPSTGSRSRVSDAKGKEQLRNRIHALDTMEGELLTRVDELSGQDKKDLIAILSKPDTTEIFISRKPTVHPVLKRKVDLLLSLIQ